VRKSAVFTAAQRKSDDPGDCGAVCLTAPVTYGELVRQSGKGFSCFINNQRAYITDKFVSA